MEEIYLKNLALGYLVICYLFLADWNKFSRIRKFILENVNSLIIDPFSLMVFINSNLILLNNNSKYNKNYISSFYYQDIYRFVPSNITIILREHLLVILYIK